MASIINSTTTAGVTVTGDNSGSLQLATNNGTTAVTIDTNQRAAFVAGTAALPAITTTGDTNTGIFFPAADTIAFSEGGTESARFDSSGQLNIGSTTQNGTTSKLYVRQATDGGFKGLSVISSASQQYVGSFSIISGGILDINQSYLDGSGSYQPISFTTSGSERMRITSGGNLEMASNAGFLQLATNQTMRIPSTGGIGYVGHINSSTVFQIAYNSTSAGVQLSSGATSWGTFSDSRLKNITGTYTNALNDIAQIQPVKFTWKSDEDNKPQVGVIAQSVQNVVPESVDSTTIKMDGTEEYLTVRYTELIPLMIASIQELKAELDATKAEVQALKGTL